MAISHIYRRVFMMLPFLAITAGLDWFQYRNQGELTFLRWPRLALAALLGGFLLVIYLLSQAEQSEPFVYQRF